MCRVSSFNMYPIYLPNYEYNLTSLLSNDLWNWFSDLAFQFDAYLKRWQNQEISPWDVIGFNLREFFFAIGRKCQSAKKVKPHSISHCEFCKSAIARTFCMPCESAIFFLNVAFQLCLIVPRNQSRKSALQVFRFVETLIRDKWHQRWKL